MSNSIKILFIEPSSDVYGKFCVSYGEQKIAEFYERNSADRFITTDLCKYIIEHIDSEEQQQKGNDNVTEKL